MSLICAMRLQVGTFQYTGKQSETVVSSSKKLVVPSGEPVPPPEKDVPSAASEAEVLVQGLSDVQEMADPFRLNPPKGDLGWLLDGVYEVKRRRAGTSVNTS